MPEVTVEQVPQKVKDLFNKAFGAFERGNLDYAMDLFIACLEIEPGFLRARRFLRAAAIQQRKAAGANVIAGILVKIKAVPTLLATSLAIKRKKGAEALISAENLVRFDPTSPAFVLIFADAAVLGGLPEAAVLTLETAREHRPGNVKVLRRLADLYTEIGDTKNARDLFERLSAMRPNDPSIVKAYKDAMAMHSMQRDGWTDAAEGGTFRDVMKSKDEAVMLEREAKAVKSDSDAEDLIEDALKKLEIEPDNMNAYRTLARLYAQRGMFEESIGTLEEALRRSPGDPEMDQMLSNVRLQQMDAEIRRLRESGDEAAADAAVAEKAQFVLSDLGDRVHRYPNDLRLRYEYGVALYKAERLNEAIQQLQAAQRNPKTRTRALYYLALCFKQKDQFDMAAQQLTVAASEITLMDGTKKDILYELGSLYEAMGDVDRAVQYFKEIYQVDISFRDVSDKVEKMYGRK
jgi:tetratricopeptide (TPR) repeat protein